MKQAKLAYTAEGLTLKEERFCLAFFENGGNATEAYIEGYEVKPESRDAKWVRTEAWKLLRRPHVRARIEMLRKRIEETKMYSIDRAMREAGEAFEMAKVMRNAGGMVNAVKLRAQLAGHLVEKKEVTSRSERSLSDEELDQMLKQAAAAAGFAITKASESSK